jgi:TRAP-type C4-dicarboxylate transport system permease small subunit
MLMLLFAFVFVVGGFQFARFGATQSSEISGLPMLTIYIAWPLAGLSWILFIVEQIYRQFYYQQKS